ncbi:MAG: mannitol dehydrogenase family protein [Saccharofermentanales bacterium]
MKKFLQYGAGNIGRGFIGQLFSQAGYEVSFIDINMEVINALNKDGRYPVTIVSKLPPVDVWVENVKGINGMDRDAVIDAIAGADAMATAIGVNILTRIVPLVADGIKKRKAIGNDAPLNIIICENLLDADKLLHRLLLEHFDASEKDYFEKNIGLVEASIGRMVPVMTEEQKKGNPLRVYVENYCELPVDKDAFKGEIPAIGHLFPYSPFELYIKRKLYIHNMGHALIAYLGNLAGYEYTWQAMANPYIKLIGLRAMQESAMALTAKFNVPAANLLDHIADLQLRFANIALGDTVMRVGKDLRRKLSAEDRFAGAVKTSESQGITPVYTAIGIAAALFFNCPDDPGTDFVHGLSLEGGIEAVLSDICEITPDNPSYPLIISYYSLLKNNRDFAALLALAEDYQEKILRDKKVI